MGKDESSREPCIATNQNEGTLTMYSRKRLTHPMHETLRIEATLAVALSLRQSYLPVQPLIGCIPFGSYSAYQPKCRTSGRLNSTEQNGRVRSHQATNAGKGGWPWVHSEIVAPHRARCSRVFNDPGWHYGNKHPVSLTSNSRQRTFVTVANSVRGWKAGKSKHFFSCWRLF